jgi:alanyl-tRNA synthetase
MRTITLTHHQILTITVVYHSSGEDSKIVTVQKCIRVGGKNCDLENVGMSPRHLSFFEMLGFFQLPPASLQFKRDSIQLAMQFLTGE